MDEVAKKQHNRKFALLWSLFMGVVFGFINIVLGIVVFLAYMAYFMWISPHLDRKKKQRLIRTYAKIQEKMPAATPSQRELPFASA